MITSTTYKFGHSSGVVGARTGFVTPPIVFAGHHTTRLPWFHFLQTALKGKVFTSDEGIKSLLEQLFFAKKDRNVLEHEIMMLPDRWQT